MVLDISLVFSAVRHLVVRVLCDVPLCSQLLLASAVKIQRLANLPGVNSLLCRFLFVPKVCCHTREEKNSSGIEASGPAGLNPTTNSRSALREIHLQFSNRKEKKDEK